MIHLRLRTEYSFRRAFGMVGDVMTRAGGSAAAITDSGTWGHVAWAKEARLQKVKPLFGAECLVVEDATRKGKEGKQHGTVMAFLARDAEGLRELYRLMSWANGDGYYYLPRLDYNMVNSLSEHVFILSGAGPRLDRLRNRPTVYLEMSPSNPAWNRSRTRLQGWSWVVCADNAFVLPEDRAAYEVLAAEGRRARTSLQHIPEEEELRLAIPEATDEDFLNTDRIAAEIDCVLPEAVMVKFTNPVPLSEQCMRGARDRGLMINPIYQARLQRELALIKEKGFEDYFYVITDMVQRAKTTMLVGPARGSSAGSLVCFLLGITDVDPIKHDLMFERFIDITRADLPDIDIDFPDDRRAAVISQLGERYGVDRVGRLGTIMRYKAKSALTDVSKQLGVPSWEVKDVKEAVIDRSTGDARAQFCIQDAFDSLEIGKALLLKYPQLRVAALLEGHARQSGTHAAGLVVTEFPLTHYGTIDHSGVLQLDKRDAERLNLLKIDALGLRTLAVLQDCLDSIGKAREYLLTVPLDDDDAFEVFNSERYAGIFQYEGYALQNLTRQMKIREFNDVCVITALARPGPLHNGGADDFIKRRTGRDPVTYLHPLAEPYTRDTYGTIVYQEQVMAVGRAVGKMTWEDVSELRKAMSKSLGEEFFNRYWIKFRDGASEHKIPEAEARRIWDKMCTFGCLGGKTILRLPGSNQYTLRTITIEQLYKNGGIGKVAIDVSNRSAQRSRKARLYTSDGKRLYPKPLVEVYKKGSQITWRVDLSDGKSLRATLNHQFYTANGWIPLVDLAIGDTVAVLGPRTRPSKFTGTGSGAHNPRHGQTKLFLARVKILHTKYTKCQVCKRRPYQETHHHDRNRKNNAWDNLIPICRTCHKAQHPLPVRWSRGHTLYWVTIKSISNSKMEMTYDIAMPEPEHCYLANDILVHNSWAFNKSHAVSYGLLSYWCAYLKAHHPLEYAAACLRSEKNDTQGRTILQELVLGGFKHTPVDPERSGLNWEVRDGELIGGLTNVKGIGITKAQDILARRRTGKDLLPGQAKLLANPATPYDDLFEGERLWGDYYRDPKAHQITSGPVTKIKEIQENGTYIFIAKLMEKNLRDLNEYGNVAKRGGRLIKRHNLFLNMVLQDDTGFIFATISRYDYRKWGKPIIESGKVGEWYLFKGEIRNNWRKVYVSMWRRLSA